MKKRSKRYKELEKLRNKDKKIEVKEIIELLRIEPRHKELEDALTYASGMDYI